MKIKQTKLNDCYVIEPIVHGDERGFFLETFHEERYKKLLNIDLNFVQIIIHVLQKMSLEEFIFKKSILKVN